MTSSPDPPSICLVCQDHVRTPRALSAHLQHQHHLTSRDYTIRFLGGLPSCEVQDCPNLPRYTSFGWKRFCGDHAHVAESLGGKTPKKPRTSKDLVSSSSGRITTPWTPEGYGGTDLLSWEGFPLTGTWLSEQSPETRERVVQALFGWFREHGFPYPCLTLEEREKSWRDLQDPERLVRVDLGENLLSVKDVTGNDLVRHWNGKGFFSVAGARMPSMEVAFARDETLLRVLRNRCQITFSERFRIHGAMLRQGFRSTASCQMTSTFNCLVARWVWDHLTKGLDHPTVYDFSGGFGHRMLGALAVSRVARYTSVDPWTLVVEGNLRMAESLGQGHRVSLVNQGAESFVCPSPVDVAFSSPPYWTQEVYDRGGSGQSVTGYQTPEAWVSGWWSQVVRNLDLSVKPGGVIALNMVSRHLDAFLEVLRDGGWIETKRFHLLLPRSHLAKGGPGSLVTTKTEPVVVLRRVAETSSGC